MGPHWGSEAKGQTKGLPVSAECVHFGSVLYSGEKTAPYHNISGAQGKEHVADIFTKKSQFGLDC